MKQVEEPIRIAQVIGKACAGGVESVIFNYYRHLDHSKIQFDFFIDEDSVCSIPQDILESGAKCIVIPPYQKLKKYIATLKKYFKENKYKIVHSNMNTLSVFSLYAAKKAKVPIRICHSHSTASKGEVKKNIIKYLLRPFSKLYATNFFACSEYAGGWLFGRRAIKKNKVIIINNAIDTDKFKYDTSIRQKMRNELSLGDEFVIGNIGRYVYQKNHVYLIDIFNEIHKSDLNAKLILLGGGPLEEEVKQKVKKLGLSDCVKFLGIKSNTSDYYQAMDVFLLPSKYEGLPVVLVEAQAAGLPIVASDVITREAKLTPSFQVVSLNSTPAEWSKTILEYKNFCRLSSDLKKVQDEFDIRIQAKKLQYLYLNMLNKF